MHENSLPTLNASEAALRIDVSCPLTDILTEGLLSLGVAANMLALQQMRGVLPAYYPHPQPSQRLKTEVAVK